MFKLIAAALFTTVVAAPGVGLAAQQARCNEVATSLGLNTPGAVNQYFRDTLGSPGQVAKDPLVNPAGLPANEVAAIYNNARKEVCPAPGQID